MTADLIHTLEVRNVQEAYVRGVALLRERGQWEETRNGRALVVPEPVVTCYERPWERVLLDPSRDANPFFHLLECFWMLAGRRDVESIARFAGQLKEYSDDGVNFHAAYGYRWRQHFDVDGGSGEPIPDQIRTLIEELRRDPASRRLVLTMWDPVADLGQQGRDFPCNTQVYLRTREVSVLEDDQPTTVRVLDLTVTCRSNDAIWGAWGSNAVHFSVLHEFLAAAAGLRQGRMYQWHNNLHAYEAVLEKVGEPCWPVTWARGGDQYKYVRSIPLAQYTDTQQDDYTARELKHKPLFKSTGASAGEIMAEMDIIWQETERLWEPDGRAVMPARSTILADGTTRDVYSMVAAYHNFKQKNWEGALFFSEKIESPDWRRACVEWLERRRARAVQ